MSPAELAAELKARAREAGADLVGIAEARPAPDADAYDRFIAAGMHGEMDYLARNAESRRDLRAWMPAAKTVLMCGFSYGDSERNESAADGLGRVAKYATRADYHEILRARMNRVRDWLKSEISGSHAVAFSDMSPILERSYARAAGLGWQGKNTMLIGPRLGSYFLLAGLAMSVEVPVDSPAPDHCGTCTRCLDACPTDAFPQERVLDATRCVSYFTIEVRGPIPAQFRGGVGQWIYGCDACQDVCPWNRFETPARALPPATIPAGLPLEELAGPSSTGIRARLKGLPVARAVRKRLTRNALLAMGNSGLARFRPILEKFADGADELLSEQARWSLEKLPPSQSES